MSAAWLRVLFVAVCLAGSLPAAASPRAFPSDSFQVMLTAVSDPYLTIDGTVVQMSNAVIIFGPTNTTVVHNVLQPNSWIRIQFDGACLVRRIWIINSEEVAPVPFWSGWFSSGFTPPTCPAAAASQ